MSDVTEKISVGKLTQINGKSVVVKPFSLKTLTLISAELPAVYEMLSGWVLDSKGSTDEMEYISRALVDPKFRGLITFTLASVCEGLEQDELEDMDLNEIFVIIESIKEVQDLKKLWRNFSMLIPKEMLEGFKEAYSTMTQSPNLTRDLLQPTA